MLQPATLHARFEAQADRYPSRVAVTADGESCTYSDVDRRANRLAHYLRSLGAGPQTLVGICLPRGLDLIIAIVAVVKAGAAYVPLDPENPPERLGFYLHDSAAPLLITTTGFLPTAVAGMSVVHLDVDGAELANWPDTRPPQTAGPDDLAYVIYTSGSTGVPKGVMVTQRNVVRLFDSTDHWYGFQCSDVWTMFHSAAFDFSVWEIWGALLYGGRLVVLPFTVTRSPESVARIIREEGVTVLNQTPSAFRQVSRAILESPDNHNLRYIIFGGEALDFTSLREWVARYGARRTALINMYGITETTVHVTYRKLSAHDVENAVGSMIGEPIPDLGLMVLNDRFEPVGAGERGEIYVTGEGVAAGYINRPELTAERFLNIRGVRAYRSGDLGRPTPKGDLEYLGRIDQQVKVRGFRIEPGEICARLSRHPQIRDNVVIAVGGPADSRLVAYCVPLGSRPSPSDLRRFLATQLPDYMIPAAFVFVDVLPLTTNGKLDRNALAAPVEDAAPFSEPQTDTERLVAEAWRDVLHCPTIGRDDNFLALGGDSLSAARVAARLSAARSIDLSIGVVLQSPALADLAMSLDAGAPSRLGVPVPVRRDGPLPASIAQQRLWYQWRLDPHDVAYNETLTVRMQEAIDCRALETALSVLVERHESLRTSFRQIGGALVQVIEPAAPVRLSVVDSATPSALASEMATQPFDLECSPLWRVRLVRAAQTEYQLLFTIHHSVWDGLSEAVFVGELEQLYRLQLAGSKPMLPPVTVQSGDLTAWEDRRLANSDVQPQIDYWTRKLGGTLPVLRLSSARTRPEMPSPSGARVPISLTERESDAVRDFAGREHCTLFQVLLAAIYGVLHRYSGQNDFCVGTVHSTRRFPGAESVIGYHVSPLVLRTKFDGSLSFRELLRRVRETTLEAHAHPDPAPETIIEFLRPPRVAGVNPLFQAGFSLAPRVAPSGAWTWRHDEVFNGCAKFELSWQLGDQPEGIRGHLEYKTTILDPDLAESLARETTSFLLQSMREPDRPIGYAGAFGARSPAEIERELLPFLATRLPDYMIPSTFVFVDALPLTPSGKVDRKALPAPPRMGRVDVKRSTTSDNIQSVVAAIWEDVLAMPDVPLDTPFFDLGGHSLALARVQIAVHEKLSFDVPMVALLRHTTVRALAAYLATRSPATATMR